MAGEPAVDGDAKKTLFGAKGFVAVETVGAMAAADPGEYGLPCADQGLRPIGPHLLHDPCYLVSQRERQGHAAGGVELPAAPEVGVAVLNVQVGMAQPAALDADERFPTLRFRRFDDGFAQRRIELD